MPVCGTVHTSRDTGGGGGAGLGMTGLGAGKKGTGFIGVDAIFTGDTGAEAEATSGNEAITAPLVSTVTTKRPPRAITCGDEGSRMRQGRGNRVCRHITGGDRKE